MPFGLSICAVIGDICTQSNVGEYQKRINKASLGWITNSSNPKCNFQIIWWMSSLAENVSKQHIYIIQFLWLLYCSDNQLIMCVFSSRFWSYSIKPWMTSLMWCPVKSGLLWKCGKFGWVEWRIFARQNSRQVAFSTQPTTHRPSGSTNQLHFHPTPSSDKTPQLFGKLDKKCPLQLIGQWQKILYSNAISY